MTTLARHAANLDTKPTKRELFTLVKVLAARYPDERATLAQLYHHLLPPPPKGRTGFDWVAQACAPGDAVRRHLSYVHVTDEWLTATDGHRLHRLRNHDGARRQPGWYNHAGDFVFTLEEGERQHRYPDVERVSCHNRWDEKTTEVVLKELPVEGEKAYRYYPIPTDAGYEIHVNKTYLDDAVRGCKAFTVRHVGMADAIRIDFDADRYAIVMPIRQ